MGEITIRQAQASFNVRYHSLLELATGQQVCGRFVRNADFSPTWLSLLVDE
jgi:hypothetical protein